MARGMKKGGQVGKCARRQQEGWHVGTHKEGAQKGGRAGKQNGGQT